MYDLIIIGGSAAGTAAAIYAARARFNFLLIAKDFGGEVATSGEIENYPGFAHTDGIELTKRFREQLEAYKVPMELDVAVTSIRKEKGIFCIDAERNGVKIAAARISGKPSEAGIKCSYEAKAVIVTSGVHPRELDIPGEKEFRSKGVSYCTVCDGPLFPGKRVAVIGGGNSANESGIMLAAIAKEVFVLTIHPDMKGDNMLINKLKSFDNVKIIPNALSKEIFGKTLVKGLRYEDKNTKEIKELLVDGIFVHIGMVPNSSFLTEDVEKNQFGEIKVSSRCETNIPGLFAAGDVTDVPFKQIAIATGQGVIAALAAIDYINRQEAREG